MKQFKFYCQKILPLVYDNSLSYYEVLCKVVDYINNIILKTDTTDENILALNGEIKEIEKRLDNFEVKELENIIRDFIATSVFFEITDGGYFVAYIPESWNDITFNTTGLDINLPIQPEFGHLVLSY